jgi:predicted TIM-barrel fold metal-dependent hydrolase
MALIATHYPIHPAQHTEMEHRCKSVSASIEQPSREGKRSIPRRNCPVFLSRSDRGRLCEGLQALAAAGARVRGIRRDSMSGAKGDYSHPVVRPEWLAMVREEIIEPDLPIIDPHHHLWHDRDQCRYLLEELAIDLVSGHNVVGTVFLECGWMHRQDGPVDLRPVGETEAANAVATLSATGAFGKPRACAGIVGFADLRGAALDAVLDAHIAASGRFRGIRQSAALDDAVMPITSTADVPPPGMLRDAAFVRSVRRLGERGLTYDSWAYHPQLSDLLALARAAPATAMVIDHVGGPLGCGPYRGHEDEVFAAWRADMKALAACPNVHVKLGGLAMPVNGFDYHKNPRPPTSAELAADWKRWMVTCIELFGVGRCMFESNFPVDKGMCSYPVLWNAFKRLAAGASAAEKAALFHDTAARFYRISL